MKTVVFTFKEGDSKLFRSDMLLMLRSFQGVGSFRLDINLAIDTHYPRSFITADAACILFELKQETVPKRIYHNAPATTVEVLDGSVEEVMARLLTASPMAGADQPTLYLVESGSRAAAA